MAALLPRHRKFIEEYARCGDATEAGRRVGYKEPERKGSAALRVTAHRLLHKPAAQEYLHQVLLKGITTHAPFAVNEIRRLAEHAESDAIRLAACKELLDRGGFRLAERHEFVLKDERTSEEIEASIRASALELGLAHVIDAEVVDDTAAEFEDDDGDDDDEFAAA